MLEILSELSEITYLSQTVRKCQEQIPGADRYVSSLHRLGVKVIGNDHSLVDLLRRHKFDGVIFERLLGARWLVESTNYYLPRIRILQPECAFLIDTVDVRYARLHTKYLLTQSEDDRREAEESKKGELDAYSRADAVIAVTEDDANTLKSDLPDVNVMIVPNIHNVVISDTTPQRDTLVFVGAFSHTPNVDAIVYFCKDILPRIRQDMPHVKFTIIGSKPTEEIKALSSDHITVTGHVESTTPFLHKNYISVAPLRYGAGVKGKIGEAMAHGLPVVTTSIGAQGMGLIDRENAIIADSADLFAKGVIDLIGDEELWDRIRKNGREHIEKYYSRKQAKEGLIAMLRQLERISVKRMALSEKASFVFRYGIRRANKKWSTSVLGDQKKG